MTNLFEVNPFSQQVAALKAAGFPDTVWGSTGGNCMAIEVQLPTGRVVIGGIFYDDSHDFLNDRINLTGFTLSLYNSDEEVIQEAQSSLDPSELAGQVQKLAQHLSEAQRRTRKVTLKIPAEFFGEVEVGPSGAKITRFVVMPLESYAGFFGKTEAVSVDGKPPVSIADNVAAAEAEEYWRACNDGTWPLDKIDWEE